LSFLRPIPSNRTCYEIGIPWEYCICHAETKINILDTRVQEAARVLMDHVNNFILLTDEKQLCASLTYNKTLSAHILVPPANLREGNKGHREDYLRVAVEVNPSGAQLEAVVRKRFGRKPEVLGDVNRINEYGKQSACINDIKLEMYCLCKTK